MQPILPAVLISSHMCGKTSHLFIAIAVLGQELNTDEEVKVGKKKRDSFFWQGGSDEDIFVPVVRCVLAGLL